MSDRISGSGPRYHGLDGVRATAMLLGVFYHSLMFRMMTGGGPPEFSGPSHWLQDWLHSFRMPLFFLIAGFFARMMREKYGTRDYLTRRWSRIGIPLFVALFTLVPAYVATQGMVSQFPGRGPGPGGPPPSPGFRPPPPRFEGGVVRSRPEGGRPGGPFAGPGPGFRPGGPPPGGGPFGPRGGGLGARIFGASARYFQLHHLWFLWYLLVFVTIAPGLTKLLDGILLRFTSGSADRLGFRAIRLGLVPLVLGLLSAPALMLAPSFFGWSLGLSPAIFVAFPDFLFQFQRDMPFYLVYFLCGWWLHRVRDGLPILARAWLPNFLIGVIAFAASARFAAVYLPQTGLPRYGLIRAAGYAMYGVGSAFTCFGFLGFFQRYLDHPSRAGRYLADTAFWVYLVHQPFVLLALAALNPLHLPWWGQSGLAFAMATAAALVLYELIVRRTPLVRLFGPAHSHRLHPAGPSPDSEFFHTSTAHIKR